MKRKKVLAILFLTVIALIFILVISYISESRSQKLPAVVFSDKVIISSEVDGVLKQYAVTSMQEVARNDLIAVIDNSRLPFKLETLKREKSKYEELINSARSGDILKTELYNLEQDIHENIKDEEEAKKNIGKIREKLSFLSESYHSAQKKYAASQKLFDRGIINNSEFEEASRDFRDVQNEYSELKADSLIAHETIKASRNIIRLLRARKDILSRNVDILAARHIIDLNAVEAEINDLQEEIKSFRIYSPVAGVVTDINYMPGEKVGRGDIIAEIADLNNVGVIAYGSSYSRLKVKAGQKVKIYCGRGKNIGGRVVTVSPVMEKVRSISPTFDTENTYTKIEIIFDDMKEALQYVTPGERLFVRVYF